MSGLEDSPSNDTNVTWTEPKTTTSEVDAKEEYGDVETFFQMEHLSENFDAFRQQMENIRKAIVRAQQARKRYKTDPDADIYVDESAQVVEDAFRSFKLGEATIDIRQLTSGVFSEGDIYNEIVYWANQYIEYYMIGQNVERFEEI